MPVGRTRGGRRAVLHSRPRAARAVGMTGGDGMADPMVALLRFTRDEWLRGLEGVTEDEGFRRFDNLNSIGWMVGHLAAHEQRLWLQFPTGQILVPAVQPCAAGQPASTPSLAAMLDGWRAITAAAEPYLDSLDPATLASRWQLDGQPFRESVGTSLQRITFHYWFHLGEMQAVRQLLGHTGLPNFVGNLAPVAYELRGMTNDE